ncbi:MULTISPECIES: helix-turn-helix transcriptional regulator [unclassified Labrenzia]|uniref:helix-turn-helix domain-containing protein n=1 Tax=unclassified Labrenzia TaxID=2648686 RepID=UPI0015652648|nr:MULTISPECIES: helix-turn-helix transcriptional regulator [unclassified Labrenzia]
MTDYPHKNARHPVYIFEWRKQRGFTAEKLAVEAGMTRTLLSQLETGTKRVNIDHLIALAKVLDCHPSDLLRSPEDKFNSLSLLFEHIPTDQQDKALKLLSAFRDEPSERT